MHQLRDCDRPCLDGPRFRQAVERELKKVKPILKLVLLTREGCAGTATMRKNVGAAGYSYELIDLDKLPITDTRRGYPTPTLLKASKDVFGMAEPKARADSPG